MATAEALALQIRRLGVECVFGLMSEETAVLIAQIDAAGVHFCSARHENNAVAMAEGYASSSGKLGVALIGRGPATANGLHGIVYAKKANSRVLVLLGAGADVPADPNGFGPDNKVFDAAAVLTAAGVRNMTVHDPDSAPSMLARAAHATYRGPVALLLPRNVLNGTTPASAVVRAFDAPAPIQGAAPRRAAIETASRLIEGSRKPLIIAGAGAHRAGARDAIVRLADRIGAALATTMKAKDMFRGHPFDCGVVGSFSHSAGRRLIEQADCILAFGAGLNQRTTSHGTALPAAAPLIHIDISRESLGRWLHCDVAITADARVAAEQLIETVQPVPPAEQLLRTADLRRLLAEYRPEEEFEPRHTPRTLDPRTVGIELDKLLPSDRNVVYDSGNFLSAAAHVHVPGPAHLKQASDFSSIGMGLGTALGFSRGDPDRTTVLFIGDGAFLMTLGELETAAREAIPLVIVLMNDCAYGAEVQYLRMSEMPVATAQFPDVDYAPVAAAFGFEAATVRSVDELRALAPLLANPQQPVFIDCKINGSVAAAFTQEATLRPR